MDDGYHLRPDFQRIYVSCGNYGMHSRKVLYLGLSNTLDADYCVEALEEIISKYGCPKIFNTD